MISCGQHTFYVKKIFIDRILWLELLGPPALVIFAAAPPAHADAPSYLITSIGRWVMIGGQVVKTLLLGNRDQLSTYRSIQSSEMGSPS